MDNVSHDSRNGLYGSDFDGKIYGRRMRIELEIPDWLIGEGRETRGIFLMAGIELAAYKLPNEPWMIKTARCSSCGKCCEKLRRPDSFFRPVDGRCMYLKDEGKLKKVCDLGMGRPWGCCVNMCSVPECAERYEAAT